MPSKILILGYKNYGRGKTFLNPTITDNISKLKGDLWQILGKGTVSFDNLALEQLDVKSHLTKEGWEKRYMGDDGKFTMYFDAVKMEYAISSTSNRIKVTNNIIEYFQSLKI
jgi:hypothetical protein